MSDLSLLLALGLPALVLGVATWVLRCWWRWDEGRLLSLLWLLAAAAATVALLLHDSLAITGSITPLVLPGGVVLALLPLAALPPLARWQGRDAAAWSTLLCCVLGALALGLLTFPWWDRGLMAWSVLGISALGAGLLALGTETAGRGGHRSLSLLWAAQAAAAAPFLIALAAIGHAQVLAVALAPLAGAAVPGFIGGARIFQARGLVLPAVVVAALLANAVIRYVPGSDDPAGVVWTLRLAPLALLLAPWALAGSRRLLRGRTGVVVGLIAWAAILAGGAAAAGWAYAYQGEADAGSDRGWDYSSLGD